MGPLTNGRGGAREETPATYRAPCGKEGTGTNDGEERSGERIGRAPTTTPGIEAAAKPQWLVAVPLRLKREVGSIATQNEKRKKSKRSGVGAGAGPGRSIVSTVSAAFGTTWRLASE